MPKLPTFGKSGDKDSGLSAYTKRIIENAIYNGLQPAGLGGVYRTAQANQQAKRDQEKRVVTQQAKTPSTAKILLGMADTLKSIDKNVKRMIVGTSNRFQTAESILESNRRGGMGSLSATNDNNAMDRKSPGVWGMLAALLGGFEISKLGKFGRTAGIMTIIKNGWKKFTPVLVGFIKKFGKGLIGIAAKFFDDFKIGMKMFGDDLIKLGPKFAKFSKLGAKFTKSIPVIGWVIAGVMALFDFIPAFVKAFKGKDGSIFSKLLAGGKAGLLSAINGFMEPFQIIASFIASGMGFKDVAKKIKDFKIESLGEPIKKIVTSFSDMFGEVVKDIMEKIKEVVNSIFGRVKNAVDAVKNIPDRAKDIVAPIIEGTIDILKGSNIKYKKPSKEVEEAIKLAAAHSGMDPAMLMGYAEAESSFNPVARPIKDGKRQSSAYGLYQFLDSTWVETVKKYGTDEQKRMAGNVKFTEDGLAIIDSAETKAIMDLRSDPYQSSMMAAGFIQTNRKKLEAAGIQANAGTLYGAHFMGAEGFKQLEAIVRNNPNAIGARVFPHAANRNPDIYYAKDGRPRTVKEVYDIIMNKGRAMTAAYSKDGSLDISSGPMPSLDVKKPPVLLPTKPTERYLERGAPTNIVNAPTIAPSIKNINTVNNFMPTAYGANALDFRH